MAEQEPILTEAFLAEKSEGKAFTLQYKNRFLYSKYNPQKNILAAIQGLEILPATLVLVFSPCLFYGWKELQEKCKAAGSEILCVEADSALHSFASQEIARQDLAATLLPLDQNTPRGLDAYFCGSAKKFRRVLRVDFSAGVSFAPEFYKNFFECAQNIVAAFWKNRLTLVRLGRLYSKNLFKNLLPAAAAQPFEALEGTVQKPILVCGAGESLDELTGLACSQGQNAAATEIDGKPKKASAPSSINERFFVLAVDAAIPALFDAGIKIDAVAATESQLAIEKAYIGLGARTETACKTKTAAADKGSLQEQNAAAPAPFFFFDLTSRAGLVRRFARDKNAAFYFSEFDKNNFLSRLDKNGLLPKIAPPLGSIGLTATYIALRLRKAPDIPVYVLGLDFSFSAGRTHARGTAQSKALFLQASRLRPAQNFAAAYGPASEKFLAKNGAAAWTTKNLWGYAALFRDYFKGAKKLYDAGKCGVDLGLERKSLLDILGAPALACGKAAASNDLGLANDCAAPTSGLAGDSGRVQNARRFLADELKALRDLADLLSNGDAAASRDKSIALEEQIKAALYGREYLYLHFPDGAEPSLDRSFLTRVRAQIDFFSKDIETALAAAQS